MIEPRFEYKGYKYEPEYEIEADYDNAKIYHDIITPEGERKSADFTPYSYMTEEDFAKFIDLNMPGRLTKNNVSCPLNSEDLESLAEMKAFEEFITNKNNNL